VLSVLSIILHHDPGPQAGPLERSLIDLRLELAERHRTGFEAAGAGARIVTGSESFPAAVRDTIGSMQPDGAVVLGSGSLPLARPADLRRFVAAAGSNQLVALANNRYSADVVAVPCASSLLSMPDLSGDNGLPRWLEERAGYRVDDLRARWRLQVDLDSPLDVVLLGWQGAGLPLDAVREKLLALRAAATDPSAELLVAGRSSAATLRWLERSTACRVRAVIEERGLRAASPDALGRGRMTPSRPPASLLGALLERDGPGSLGDHLARLADAAIIDSRVLMAHRLGADERAWPAPDDRFASDLLLADRIADPWLAALTRSAAAAPIPVLLGGHSLVGPGIRLALGPGR
jgi:hypothetical protein